MGHIDIPESFWEARQLGNMVNRLLDLVNAEALYISTQKDMIVITALSPF